jgi:hypothetical protein
MTKPLTPANQSNIGQDITQKRKRINPTTPSPNNKPPEKKAEEDAQKHTAILLFTALGFFLPGAFNLNYSAMFVMAILTFIVCVVYIFPSNSEA